MLEVKNENPVYNKDGSVTHHPGLMMLLGYRPNVNFADDEGDTLLIRAINAPHLGMSIEAVKQLVEAGADVNEPSRKTKAKKGNVMPVIAAAT